MPNAAPHAALGTKAFTGLLLLAGTALATPAAAQVLPSRQQLNPAQQAPVPAAPRGELFRDMEVGPCPFAGSDLKLTLTGVDIQGAGRLALSDERVALAYADLIGKQVPVSAACTIRDRLAALYLRRGVLAAVTIPEQRIADGRLILSVTEAHVESVSYHGDAGPAQRQVARYLDKLKGLAPFDLNVAQRYLLLASDVPGVVVQASLRQAPGGNGAVDLDIAVSRTPVTASFAINNYGSESIGRDLATARVDYNSFTALGERTSIVGYGTLASPEQRVIQATETLKIGGEGLQLDLSGSFARTRPGAALKPLDLIGNSFAGNARLTYPILRHRRYNLNVAGGLEWIDQKVDFGGGIATLTDDKLRVFYARLDGHVAPRELAAHSVAATGSIELRKGIDGLGATPFGNPLASRFGGRPDATVVRADVQVAARLFGPLTASISTSWQYTDTPLLSYEEFSAGTLSIGRGYDPSAASGDRALGSTLEISTAPFAFAKRSAFRPYAFLDAVRLTNIGPGADQVTLRSAGYGIRAQIGPWLSLDAAWAHPFDRVAPTAPKPGDRFLVSLSASIF
ncbi:ShlB/FhaC/HecB family hemolysin secretion/activation protein [Sphingomonas sp. KR3-1]|uniref:ShlB/FhaC/HecB family hemolysin secretion/activation protein n=1 Tax=Sphingomonas sp. KR3-1 TaxID=3156611 RepID=UPI0032B3288E